MDALHSATTFLLTLIQLLLQISAQDSLFPGSSISRWHFHLCLPKHFIQHRSLLCMYGSPNSDEKDHRLEREPWSHCIHLVVQSQVSLFQGRYASMLGGTPACWAVPPSPTVVEDRGRQHSRPVRTDGSIRVEGRYHSGVTARTSGCRLGRRVVAM
jgi:hypothetical protein